MSDDFPSWSAPPPRRRTPEHLRDRIQTDLAREQRRGRTSRVFVTLVAAAVLVITAAFGIGQLRTTRNALPAVSPSAESPSAVDTSSPSASAVASETPSPAPQRVALQELSGTRTAADVSSCTTDLTSVDHRGEYRPHLALQVPRIRVGSPEGVDSSSRIVQVEDQVGTFTCTDGRADGWARSTSAEARQANGAFPAAELDGNGTSSSCDPLKHTGDVGYTTFWAVTERVRLAVVRVQVAGQPERIFEVVPANGFVVLDLRVVGAAAWTRTTWSVQFLDSGADPVRINSARNAGVPAPRTVTNELDDCTAITGQTNRGPSAIARPASDAAGVSACRRAIADDPDTGADPGFDTKSAAVALTVSTHAAWGTILRDGDRYLACSRFPTEETSGVRTVSSQVTASTFGWAQNPIPTGGESFWAAGRIPGLRSITYTLPGGRVVDADVDPDGWWLAMTSTATAFDTEESRTDWEPVDVTVTTATATKTFTLTWSAENSCNQVSHGC